MNTRLTLAAFALLMVTNLSPSHAVAATVTAPPVTGDFIAAGGGAGSFSIVRAFDSMIGATADQSEQHTLAAKFGSQNADQFVAVFDFAVSDGWKRAGENNVSIPSDTSLTGATLANALVDLGTSNGKFNSGHLFDQLFTPKVSAQIAGDVAAKFGNDAMMSFYRVADQFFTDVKRALSSG